MLFLLRQLCYILAQVSLPLRSFSGSFKRSDMEALPLSAILH